MSIDHELQLSEYARFYGLTADHLKGNPLAALAISDNLFVGSEDDHDLFSIGENLPVDLDEKLVTGKHEALLLNSIREPLEDTLVFDEEPQLNTHRFGKIKVELPLLKTDHESDMRIFQEPVVPELANEHLPLEILDEEADEGLMWPTVYQELPEQFMLEAKKEQLDMTLDVMEYLQASLAKNSVLDTQWSSEGESLNYDRRRAFDLIMTPLMPMPPIAVPFEPSSDTGHLELLSEQSSPTQIELRQIDLKFFRDDTIKKYEDDLVAIAQEGEGLLSHIEQVGDVYSPLRGIEELPSSPPLRKTRFRDIKVEVPLTPPQSNQLPPWKRKHISGSEALLEVFPELPPPIPKPENISSDDIDRLVAKNIAPIATNMERSIEQEQLQEADTTHRVRVPIVDFSRPVAPWQANFPSPGSTSRTYPHKQVLSELKTVHFFKHKWPGSGASELALKWMPFPAALGRVETYETIQDDGSLEEILIQPEPVDPNTLMWKRDGLRIFDNLEDSDDPEIGFAVLLDSNDIGLLLRKRKLELEQLYEGESDDAEDTMDYEPTRKPVNHDAFRKIPKLSPYPRRETQRRTLKDPLPEDRAQAPPSSFAAMNSLESFMSIRNKGSSNSKFTAQQYFGTKLTVQAPDTAAPKIHEDTPAQVRQPFVPPSPTTFTIPDFLVPEQGASVIVSTSFLLRRTIAGSIRGLYPTAEMIERDFSLHSQPHGRQTLDSDQTAPSFGTIVDEADIILSPSTGLMITSVQKIKQRALPGQVAKSAIRNRIQRTAPRYERLLIVISHDSSDPSTNTANCGNLGHELNERDCEALVDFAAFCSALDDDCEVITVIGTERDLAQWIVSFMIKYAVADPSVKLMQEETLWEIFLRRAGMNAFAAQAVLSHLKPPSPTFKGSQDIAPRSEDHFGLSAFVKSSLEERVTRFKALLGGTKVLNRVARILDASW